MYPMLCLTTSSTVEQLGEWFVVSFSLLFHNAPLRHKKIIKEVETCNLMQTSTVCGVLWGRNCIQPHTPPKAKWHIWDYKDFPSFCFPGQISSYIIQHEESTNRWQEMQLMSKPEFILSVDMWEQIKLCYSYKEDQRCREKVNVLLNY